MKRAFTLIELLIVVAIIAILATIGMMNFLEAQTRSKVSRAKTDMRTLASAVESYAVDHNGYVDTFGLVKVTTPVGYISTITKDIFAAYNGSPYLGYLNARQQSTEDELQEWDVSQSTVPQRATLAGHSWIIWSNGPDIEDTALKNTQIAFNDVVDAPGAQYGLYYEATNGTTSKGDLLRGPKLTR
jgi:prepilin-type N-terminal cleavage/methylation domain-containing protein